MARAVRAEMTELLAHLVTHETPTADHAACRALQQTLAGEFAALGAAVEHVDGAGGSPVLIARFAGDGRPVLLLGHVDTVFPAATIGTRPFTVHGDTATGPGVFDMKAGLVQLVFALRELAGEPGNPAVTVVLNADEEIGSPGSERIIRREAASCRCALVLEPSGPDGAIKTRRKGIGFYRVSVAGRAAHPGLDFATGVNAVVELAHQVLALAAGTDLTRGSTVNVGVIGGGSGRNVVPDAAFAEVETRFWSAAEGRRLDRALRELAAVDVRAGLDVSGGVHRAPMERTPAVAELVELAVSCAAEAGWTLPETSAGGVSDGNITAAAGLPTLDGLGAVGGGAHGPDEFVRLDELESRVTLLTRLLRRIGAPDRIDRL